jgi:gamma-glutamyltranspeptidase
MKMRSPVACSSARRDSLLRICGITAMEIIFMQFTTRPEIKGTFGVVTSTHWLATATGMAMLEKGGNAFDAAVAAGFALQAVEPHLCGPLGDAPILLQRSRPGG